MLYKVFDSVADAESFIENCNRTHNLHAMNAGSYTRICDIVAGKALVPVDDRCHSSLRGGAIPAAAARVLGFLQPQHIL